MAKGEGEEEKRERERERYTYTGCLPACVHCSEHKPQTTWAPCKAMQSDSPQTCSLDILALAPSLRLVLHHRLLAQASSSSSCHWKQHNASRKGFALCCRQPCPCHRRTCCRVWCCNRQGMHTYRWRSCHWWLVWQGHWIQLLQLMLLPEWRPWLQQDDVWTSCNHRASRCWQGSMHIERWCHNSGSWLVWQGHRL